MPKNFPCDDVILKMSTIKAFPSLVHSPLELHQRAHLLSLINEPDGAKTVNIRGASFKKSIPSIHFIH